VAQAVPGDENAPARLVDARIAELNDGRGAMWERARALIRRADPDVGEAVRLNRPSPGPPGKRKVAA